MAADLPVLVFASLSDWEQWLAGPGAASGGIWLKFAKAGAHNPTLSKKEAIEGALCHGWIDGQLAKFDEHYFLTRFTPRRATSKWSEVNRDTAERLIAEGRMTSAGLAEVERAKADGRWQAAYAPASRAEPPPDLIAALAKNAKARGMFDALDGANRYAIIWRVGDAKRPETRAKRINDYVAMLARGETIHPRGKRAKSDPD
jgi:uncharacterized protein YdeI (YjbR/CyaY-like superfamily)